MTLEKENNKAVAQAVMSYFEGYMKKHIQQRLDFFRALNIQIPEGAVAFVGDSITEGFPVYELIPHQTGMLNRGINGITSQDLAENLDTIVLDSHPGKIFLLIGTNDLKEDAQPRQIADRIVDIVHQIQSRLPNSALFVLSVLPVNPSFEVDVNMAMGRSNGEIRKLNTLIEQGVSDSPATFVNVYPCFEDSDGLLREQYTTDGLHLSCAGYQKLARLLGQFLEAD